MNRKLTGREFVNICCVSENGALPETVLADCPAAVWLRFAELEEQMKYVVRRKLVPVPRLSNLQPPTEYIAYLPFDQWTEEDCLKLFGAPHMSTLLEDGYDGKAEVIVEVEKHTLLSAISIRRDKPKPPDEGRSRGNL